MFDRRASTGLLAAATVLGLSIPASASGVVTIGSNLAATPDNNHLCAPQPCTDAHRTLPATSQASGGVLAKRDGVVVRWRIKVGADTTPVALRITHPGDSEARTGAGTGPTVTPTANQTSTFEVRLPIQAGDAVGIDCCQQATLAAHANTPGASYEFWLPRLEDGALTEPFFSSPSEGVELLVNADIEPDEDEDGFGDETQDECPTDASTQGVCPDTDPPETTITKGAPNRLDRSKVKFKFASDELGSTFECKLDKKAFRPCSSPRNVKRLDEGKHKFKVIATDEAGNSDPSAAKDKFRVVD